MADSEPWRWLAGLSAGQRARALSVTDAAWLARLLELPPDAALASPLPPEALQPGGGGRARPWEAQPCAWRATSDAAAAVLQVARVAQARAPGDSLVLTAAALSDVGALGATLDAAAADVARADGGGSTFSAGALAAAALRGAVLAAQAGMQVDGPPHAAAAEAGVQIDGPAQIDIDGPPHAADEADAARLWAALTPEERADVASRAGVPEEPRAVAEAVLAAAPGPGAGHEAWRAALRRRLDDGVAALPSLVTPAVAAALDSLSPRAGAGSPPPEETVEEEKEEVEEEKEEKVDGLELVLHHDIKEMASEMRRIAERRRPWQIQVIQLVQDAVASVVPEAQVQAYGSFSTGLAGPGSDVDLVVSPAGAATLAQLATALEGQQWVQSVQTLPRASVPVIKLTTAAVPTAFGNTAGVIHVDITVARPGEHEHEHEHRGVETSVFVQRLLCIYPNLRPLALVLKQFLVEKGLNDPYTGGLSSYALVLMITSILTRFQLEPIKPDLGTLLLLFLSQFGTGFDSRKFGISNRPGPSGPLFRLGSPNATFAGDPVVIEDPLRADNNVGRGCFGFAQVQAAFAEALAALRRTDPPPPGGSLLGRAFSTLHHKHVVQLAAQVWCPTERNAPPTPPRRAKRAPAQQAPAPAHPLAAWAAEARGLLEVLSSAGACAVCRVAGGHAAGCILHRLVTTAAPSGVPSLPELASGRVFVPPVAPPAVGVGPPAVGVVPPPPAAVGVPPGMVVPPAVAAKAAQLQMQQQIQQMMLLMPRPSGGAAAGPPGGAPPRGL